MTDGFGPKEYALHRAPAGAYRVRVNGYDADRINPNGPRPVLIHLQRNFGRPREAQELVDLDLSFQTGRNRDDEDETRPVATLRVSRQRVPAVMPALSQRCTSLCFPTSAARSALKGRQDLTFGSKC